MKNSNDDKTDRVKKVSFNIFKSMNTLSNNLYLSQKKTKEENNF